VKLRLGSSFTVQATGVRLPGVPDHTPITALPGETTSSVSGWALVAA
jgi:hypothetical protein